MCRVAECLDGVYTAPALQRGFYPAFADLRSRVGGWSGGCWGELGRRLSAVVFNPAFLGLRSGVGEGVACFRLALF